MGCSSVGCGGSYLLLTLPPGLLGAPGMTQSVGSVAHILGGQNVGGAAIIYANDLSHFKVGTYLAFPGGAYSDGMAISGQSIQWSASGTF